MVLQIAWLNSLAILPEAIRRCNATPLRNCLGTPLSVEIHVKFVKKYKKITHELNELRKFGDMRHPTSRYSHGLGWMWPGLERRRAASNASNAR